MYIRWPKKKKKKKRLHLIPVHLIIRNVIKIKSFKIIFYKLLIACNMEVEPWCYVALGVRCSSVVECPLMVRWVIRSILMVYSLSYFLFQPVLHD